jgi:hypothetical protein
VTVRELVVWASDLSTRYGRKDQRGKPILFLAPGKQECALAPTDPPILKVEDAMEIEGAILVNLSLAPKTPLG